MSTTYWVEGIAPPDDKWKQMKAVWDACKAIDIDPPSEVIDFFNDERPDPAGIVITVPKTDYWDHNRSAGGFVVDLETLPKHIKQLRFLMS